MPRGEAALELELVRAGLTSLFSSAVLLAKAILSANRKQLEL
jgi:hypothetical protein